MVSAANAPDEKEYTAATNASDSEE
jgi:hypothetical protein